MKVRCERWCEWEGCRADSWRKDQVLKLLAEILNPAMSKLSTTVRSTALDKSEVEAATKTFSGVAAAIINLMG